MYSGARLPVALFQAGANGFVVAGQGLVGVAGDAASHELRIEDADQAVAVLNVGVEEGQRLARLDGFDPEGCLAEFDRKLILVDAVDAVLNDLAQGMLAGALVGTIAIRLDADDFGGHATGRGQEKVP